ncbi:MAG: hydrogenase nickel incorporation protein HypB [Candidatus Latescibacterota bacterium]|nr:MAG: hydrogenase nickel incorporation protein HypB [Candidatus Latescibacterota bacterium]
MKKRIALKQKVLENNDSIARRLRAVFESQKILTLNMIGSPGAGKTALLEQTLRRLPSGLRAAVLTGDIETDNDAARLARFGKPVRQITTGGACHLDAGMIERELDKLETQKVDILFVENVGNLVCPASFDLGEASKIVVLSVTEGDDKPIKYPATFAKADLLVLNKIDLLPHVPFDLARARGNAKRVRPGIDIIETSCLSGEGIDDWLRWIQTRASAM